MESSSIALLARIERYDQETEALQPLGEEVARHIEHPQGGDQRIAACMTAVERKMYDPDDPRLRRELIADLMDPEAPGYGEPKHSVLKLVRAIQSPLLKYRKMWNYPGDFTDPGKWEEAIDWIFSDDVRHALFSYDLYVRQVQSNKPQRYISIPVITGLFRDRYGRFEEPLRVLDLGSSLNLGLEKLASESPFGSLQVVRHKYDHLEVDQAETTRLNELAHDYHLEEGIGIDKVDFSDPGAVWWAMSNSYYPSEWVDRDVEAELDYIESIEGNHHNIHLKVADFAVRDSIGALELEFESFDVVFTSSADYEATPLQRQAARRNKLRYAKPDGLIIDQDFSYLTQTGARRFYKNFFDRPYKYRAIVTDKARLERGQEEFLIYENGRCKRLQLGLGALALNRSIKRGQSR